MMKRLLLCSLASALGACMPATHLVYVYQASAGLDVAYSNEGSGRMVFGYDRDTFAIVPQKRDKGSTEDKELMSLTAVSSVSGNALANFEFNQFVATGDAAAKVALDADGITAIRSAIYGETR